MTFSLVNTFLIITCLGDWKFLLPLAVLVGLLFWARQKHHYAIPLWLIMAGSTLSGFLLKIIIHRPRPEGAVYLEQSYSFPSAHATLVVAFYGFLIYFFWREIKVAWLKWLLITLCSVLIVAIGYSRVYLGVHYASDVIGGYCLGLLWLMLGIRKK